MLHLLCIIKHVGQMSWEDYGIMYLCFTVVFIGREVLGFVCVVIVYDKV